MGNIERYDLAKAAAPVVLREAEVEGISLTAAGAHRLAYVAVGDVAEQLRGAVDALREVRGMLTDGDGDAIMGCRQAVARIDRALRHSGGQ
jgi:hypothetical protein